MDEFPKGFVLRDQYRILSSIGRGATSRVYLAKDLRGGQLCAIKAITVEPSVKRDPYGSTDMVLSEARLLTSLSHDGLPKVYDFFFLDDLYYMIMEWVAGQTLFQILIDRGMPCGETDVISWGLEMCQILGYLHNRKPNPVIVGDIKPNNIIRTYEGRIKLIDFGIARYADTGVKVTGHTFVTPGFSPPEQYGKLAIDHRSDIYALGASLYFLLTAENMDRFRFQVPELRSLVPACTRQMEVCLSRCMQPERNNRYQNVDEVKADLLRAQEVDRRRDNVNTQARDILASLYKQKRNPR